MTFKPFLMNIQMLLSTTESVLLISFTADWALGDMRTYSGRYRRLRWVSLLHSHRKWVSSSTVLQMLHKWSGRSMPLHAPVTTARLLVRNRNLDITPVCLRSNTFIYSGAWYFVFVLGDTGTWFVPHPSLSPCGFYPAHTSTLLI